MPSVPEDNLLGRLAIHYKLLSKDQLVEALQQQAREGGRRRIGEIFIERGWISAERFQQLLAIQREYQARLAKEAAERAAATADSPTAPAERREPIAAAAPAAAARAPSPPSPPATATPAMTDLLRLAAERGASDLHLHCGLPARVRLDGELVDAGVGVVDGDRSAKLLAEVLSPAQQQELAERGQVDLAFDLPGVARFRANVYRQQRGADGVFRVIPPVPPTLSELGLPLDLARHANYHQGLVLLTGPTGSGKSSTLAALVRIINEERRDHVITIEDPIEFVHRPQRCVVNQREVGHHTRSFSRALRAALREDPDVIVVGELRDLETISLALTAAETGHLVLATLHTQNAINTINRLVGVFPPGQQAQIRTMVSESLRAVTSQRLARRADGRGRVAALEVLVANRAVANLIRESKTFQIRSVLQTGTSQGMRALDASLEELVQGGVITAEEARRHAEDPRRFAARATAAPPVPPGGGG
ncbi:MAG TPA: type IV pilus twitching motility protein PilT [Thermoanaerobaculia bacterium]|nr:type IV pilus twitching motility protein PilT [Thermoanaerobaculia bacterium]